MISFTLESALQARDSNTLGKWVQDYLHNEGHNNALADSLEKESITYSISRYPILNLKRIMGPESGMKFFESLEVWEQRVKELEAKIVKREIMPPLIVTNIWGKDEIADGAHRHEALLRQGYTDYWVIFCKK